MSRLDEDKVKLLIHKIGLDYKLQDEVIKKIINSPYKFTRETIANLDVSPDITEEEFSKLKTNFIYLYIGKLYTSYDIYKKLKNLSNKRWKKE